MRVNIKQQWPHLVDWYYNQCPDVYAMSIWQVIERDYGALKCFPDYQHRMQIDIEVSFPDEKRYLMFVLKYS